MHKLQYSIFSFESKGSKKLLSTIYYIFYIQLLSQYNELKMIYTQTDMHTQSPPHSTVGSFRLGVCVWGGGGGGIHTTINNAMAS